MKDALCIKTMSIGQMEHSSDACVFYSMFSTLFLGYSTSYFTLIILS